MPLDTQRRDLERALRRFQPSIRDAFLRAIERAAQMIDETALIEALDRNDLAEAARIVRLDDSTLFRFGEEIRTAFFEGGELAERVFPRGLRGTFSFNGRHHRAEEWVRGHVGDLIQGIQAEQIEMTRQIVRTGLEEGRGSSAVAREIVGRRVGRKRVGGYIGLTTKQAQSIASGRAKLASGDPKLMRQYLSLKQRDKRFDGLIRKAIDEGKPITGKRLSGIMEAHRSKALTFRGRVISRHEAHRALAAGQEEGMRQALERPDVERISVRWQHNHSLEPRTDHVAMNGTVIDLGQSFEFPDGTRMRHPFDVNAPARHTIGCRCTAFYRLHYRRS